LRPRHYESGDEQEAATQCSKGHGTDSIEQVVPFK